MKRSIRIRTERTRRPAGFFPWDQLSAAEQEEVKSDPAFGAMPLRERRGRFWGRTMHPQYKHPVWAGVAVTREVA